MKKNFNLRKTMRYLTLGLVASLALTSCVGYYYADGIYNDPVPERVRYVERESYPERYDYPPENRYTPNKYKDFFSEKAQQYQQKTDSSFTHFTDVNSYRSNAYTGNSSYGGWGSNPSRVNVNVYNNGWVNPYYGWNNYWGYGAWYPNYYGYYGYYDYPYYRHRSGWSFSLGWGWGNYYDPYWGGYYGGYYPYYSYYGYPYYYGYYGYPYYGYYPYDGYYDHYYDRRYYDSDYRVRERGYRRSYTGDTPRDDNRRDYPSYDNRSRNTYSRPYDEGRYRSNNQNNNYNHGYSSPQYDSGRSYDNGRYNSGGNYGSGNSGGNNNQSSGAGTTRRDY